MKLQRLGRNISVLLLLGVFIYSTSVRELHYGFSSYAKHHAEVYTDHCDHHIHSTHQEDDCVICKIDVATLHHTTPPVYSYDIVFLSRPVVSLPDGLYFITEVTALSLRGPPSLG